MTFRAELKTLNLDRG